MSRLGCPEGQLAGKSIPQLDSRRGEDNDRHCGGKVSRSLPFIGFLSWGIVYGQRISTDKSNLKATRKGNPNPMISVSTSLPQPIPEGHQVMRDWQDFTQLKVR